MGVIMKDTIRVGILGTGFIAQTRHIPILQGVPDVEITHAWSLSQADTKKVADQFGIPNVVERWEQIIESPDIDAVVVATPPIMHMPATLAAIEAGKHVLCQARMARNLKEARQMLDASLATDLVTSLYACGFGLKGDRVMRRLIHDENYIGDILEVRAVSFYEAIPEIGQWTSDPETAGVNTMMLGILAEVLYRWIDPVTAVTAISSDDPLSVPRTLGVVAELQGGGTASFHLSNRVGNGPGNSVEIYGTRGSLDYKLLSEKPGGVVTEEEIFGRTEGESELHPIAIPPEEQRDRTMDVEFIEAIRHGTPVAPDFAEGVRYMEFSEAVAQSLYEGRKIPMPPEPKMLTWGRLL